MSIEEESDESEDDSNQNEKPEFKRYNAQKKYGQTVQFNKLSKKEMSFVPQHKYNNDGPAFESTNLNFERIQSYRNTQNGPTFKGYSPRKQLYEFNNNPDPNVYSQVFQVPFEHSKSLDVGALKFESRGPK